MSTNHRSIETQLPGAGRPGERRGATGLVWGLAAVALLTACGDRDAGRKVGDSRPAASTPVAAQPSPADVPPDGAGGNLPVEAPAASLQPSMPPTAEETLAAWSEGVALYESGDYEGASARLQIAAAGRSEDAYAHYLHGLALWKSGHLDESEAALQCAAEINDGSARTFVNLARVRLDKKDAQGALEAADRALTLEPGSAQVLHQRGRALDGLNRADEARDTLQQAHLAEPANGYIANTLGYLLLRQGRTDEAVSLLETARDLLPSMAYVRNNLGVAYERRGEVDKAVDEFRAAVDAGDSDGKAAESLARLEPIMERRMARRPDAAAPEPSGVAVADTGDVEEPPDR